MVRLTARLFTGRDINGLENDGRTSDDRTKHTVPTRNWTKDIKFISLPFPASLKLRKKIQMVTPTSIPSENNSSQL